MKKLVSAWKENKLQSSMVICFLATVFASFFGNAMLSFSVPGIGEVYPFRVLLVITAVLYLVWCVRGKDPFWKDSSWLEKWCYILVGIMVIYSTISLLWAIDFAFTFRRWFNICFDLCFFFLLLRLCRNPHLLKKTIVVSLVAVVILALMGIYEIFNGGIFNSAYDGVTWFPLFMRYFQHPLTVFTSSNEYAATLVFIGAAALFGWTLSKRKNVPSWQVWVLVIAIPLMWFLLLASDARLCQVAFIIALIGFLVYMFFCNWKKAMILLVAVLLVGGVQFAHQYRFIVPPIQQYMAEMKEYKEQMAILATATMPTETVLPSTAPTETLPPTTPTETAPPSTEPTETLPPTTPTETVPPVTVPIETIPKPTLDVGDPNAGFNADEFVVEDDETGEIKINNEGSGGVRLALLLHAFRCFKESYGLGCGLGNTEQLALTQKVVKNEAGDFYYYSIHCFIARIIADYGIFVLIPLCIIGFLLLKKGWQLFVSGIKEKSLDSIGLSFFYVCCLLVFPIASTASSDAQDLFPMWIYLAIMVLYANFDFGKQSLQREVKTDP